MCSDQFFQHFTRVTATVTPILCESYGQHPVKEGGISNGFMLNLWKSLHFSTFFCIGKFSLRIIIFESHSYIKYPIHSFQTEFLWLVFLEWSCEPAEIFFRPAIYDFDVLISSYFWIAFEPKNGTYPKFSFISTIKIFVCVCVNWCHLPYIRTSVCSASVPPLLVR